MHKTLDIRGLFCMTKLAQLAPQPAAGADPVPAAPAAAGIGAPGRVVSLSLARFCASLFRTVRRGCTISKFRHVGPRLFAQLSSLPCYAVQITARSVLSAPMALDFCPLVAEVSVFLAIAGASGEKIRPRRRCGFGSRCRFGEGAYEGLNGCCWKTEAEFFSDMGVTKYFLG